jgi:hypothetical protein
MEDNSEVTRKISPDQLYLSTCEMLARYAYEATAQQQQLNILAQQVTAESTKALYAVFNCNTQQ